VTGGTVSVRIRLDVIPQHESIGVTVFKTEAQKTASGNYDVQATCTKGHTCFKKRGDRDTYKCPYCGNDVP